MATESAYAPQISAIVDETDAAEAAQAQMVDALVELALAATRVYYDAIADAQVRTEYYAGITPHLKPADSYEALHRLLCISHVVQPAYKPSKYVYPWVDLHPDLKVHSIYSGVAYEPEYLIRDDFRIHEARTAHIRALFMRGIADNAAELQMELDLLDAALPYNCEHSVPQSWFAKQEPMRGDLHHLFACESNCNSFRGNHAYYDFPDFERVIRSNCGKREANRFEPASHMGKGAVARATLYFLLRYPGMIATAGGEFDAERLPLLLTWHQQSPPDEYEMHRNAAIFAIQGNRNPLIDFPDWAEQIDFRMGFGQ